MKKIKQTNWVKIIAALKAKGLTQTQIQDKTGVLQKDISLLKHGKVKDIMHSRGEAIMRLYRSLK